MSESKMTLKEQIGQLVVENMMLARALRNSQRFIELMREDYSICECSDVGVREFVCGACSLLIENEEALERPKCTIQALAEKEADLAVVEAAKKVSEILSVDEGAIGKMFLALSSRAAVYAMKDME